MPLSFPKKIDVPVLVVIVIVGALLRKEYPSAGHWLTLSALAYYVAVNAGEVIRKVRSFGSLETKEKTRCIIFLLFSYILIYGAVKQSVSYFIVLVLFALDYLITDTRETKNE